MSNVADPPTAADIEQWLHVLVAELVKLPVADIERDVPFTEYGLDSIYVEGLCGEIEERYAVRAEASLVWDHPTLRTLTKALLSLISNPERNAEP